MLSCSQDFKIPLITTRNREPTSMPSAVPSAAAAARLLRTHLVFGANTDVGKTVVTAGLLRARLLKVRGHLVTSAPSGGNADETASASTAACATTHYIKPLQCGGSDEGWVRRHVEIPSGCTTGAPATPSPCYSAQTLFRWEMAASPHLASRVEKAPVSDEKIVKSLTDALANAEDECVENKAKVTTQPSILVETAGGVLSPSSASPDNSLTTHARGVPSSDDDGNSDPLSWGWSTQADLYQPLGLPVVLVGGGRLGGISCTLSALESLAVRGYDVQGIVIVDDGGGYGNVAALQEYAASQSSSHVRGQEFPFARQSYQVDPKQSILSLPPLPPEPEPLTSWYQSKEVEEGLDAFEDRLEYLWNKERGREDQLLSQGYYTLPPV